MHRKAHSEAGLVKAEKFLPVWKINIEIIEKHWEEKETECRQGLKSLLYSKRYPPTQELQWAKCWTHAFPSHMYRGTPGVLWQMSEQQMSFPERGEVFFFFFFLFEALIIAWVFTRTRLYMLWLQEIHNHHWFVLVILNLTAEVHIKVQHRGKTRALH